MEGGGVIKYFNKLTREEFREVCKENINWEECAKRYPQPVWCSYPNAVCGLMGCWSLMDFMVYGRNYCKHCECYIKKSRTISPNQ